MLGGQARRPGLGRAQGVVGEQAVAALGLADVLGGEGQGLGELLGEGVELGRVAFDELELELAEGLAAFGGLDVAVVDHG